MSLRARCALVLALGACLPTALPSAQHIRLSPSTLPVSTFLPIPEGSGVVFRVFESSQSNTLMRARLGFWPAPRDLQDVSHEASPGAYFVSPDARRLVYLTAYDPFDYFLVELYSQPLDGSAPPVKLNGR